MRRHFAALLTAAALAAPAHAQDFTSARGLLADITGTWAEPGRDCSQPIDTWVFQGDAVIAGQTRLDLLGIGGGGDAVRLDLVSRNSGMRVPLSISQSGGTLQVRGSGISADLQRCGTGAPQNDTITAQPLDGETDPETGPTTDELRQALGQNGGTPSATQNVETAVEEEVGAAAERRYAAELTGGWRGASGDCSWQMTDSSISADGEMYDVVSFSGSPERIGVQALGSDGTPTTFTITPAGGSASVTAERAEGDTISASLSRC